MGRKVKIERGRVTLDIAYHLLYSVAEAMDPRTILVSDGLSEKCFFFPVGGLRMSSLGPRRGADFYEVAKRLGHDVDGMARSLGLARDAAILADRIYNNDLMTSKEFRDVSHAIAADELRDFVRWEGASYEFIHGNPPPGLFLPGRKCTILSLGVKKLLNGLIEEKDTWVPLLRSLPAGLQLRLTHETSETKGTRLLLPIKTYTTIEKAMLGYRRAGLSPAKGYKQLASWIDNGLVIRRKPTPPKAPEIEREIDEIVRVMGDFLDKLNAHVRLAENFEKLGRIEEPAALYKEVGNEYLRRDERERAIEFLRRALRLQPEDLAVREKIYRLYAETKPDEAYKMGIELANALLDNGFLRRSKALLEHMRKQRGNRYELLNMLFEISIEEGNREEATRYGLELIKFLESKNRTAEMEKVQERLRSLGLTDEGITSEELELDAIIRMGSTRRWSWDRRLGVAVAVAIILIGMVLFGYDLRARLTYARWKSEARVLLTRNEDEKALQRIREAAQSFALTSVGDQAQQDYDAMDSAVRAKTRFQWKRDFNAIKKLVASGELESALSACQLLKARSFTGPDLDSVKFVMDELDMLERARSEARENIAELAEAGLNNEAWAALRVASERFPGIERGLRLDLHVDSVPSGARVRYDGNDLGTTPVTCQLTLGTYRVLQFSLPGYRSKVVSTASIDEASLPPVYLEPKSLWTANPGVRMVAPPLLIDNLVVVVGHDLGIAAVDTAASGRVIWKRWLQLGQEPSSGPFAFQGRVWLGTSDGHVFGFDVRSGDIAFERQLGSSPVFLSQIAGQLIATGSEGGLLVVQASGAVLEAELEGGIRGPALAHGPLLAVPGAKGFHLFNAELESQGTLAQEGVVAAPASDGWRLVFGTGRAMLRCIDAAGTQLWQQRLDSSPVGVVWVSVDGEVLSHLREEVRYLSQTDGRFYVSTGRFVYAVDPLGEVIDRISLKLPGAAGGDGETVVVGNAAGILYAYRSH